MRPSTPCSQVLWCEVLGFTALIALTWANEFLGLPQLLFGGDFHPTWSESTLETLVVLVVAVPVVLLTRRLLAHVRCLESLVRVCAWCQKAEHAGQWLPLDKFLSQRLDARATHGVCPDCEQKVRQELAKAPP